MVGPRSSRSRRVLGALVGASLLAGVAACGSDGSDPGTTEAPSTSAAGTDTTTTASGAASSTTATTTGDATTTSTASGGSALPGASTDDRSGEPSGAGIALLDDVRVGAHEGYERIVFEFEGSVRPGYRVGWVDGPILSDGAGEPVDVGGDAYLEIVLQPASSVDLSQPELREVYGGPDRLAGPGGIVELVRTGDFEAVLTWVAGASAERPFVVRTLTDPPRLVIDVETGP